MNKFVDAHCHFDAATFADYRGAGRFICNAVTGDDWDALLGAGAAGYISPALGLHPWYVDMAPPMWARRLKKLLADNPRVMVGETGLDRTRGNPDAQYDAFIAQYMIASQYRRSIHIHCVHAWDIMLHVFKTMPRPPVIVLHGFSGNTNILMAICQILDNVYFSYRDINVTRIRDVVAQTPLTRILVESDAFRPAPEIIRTATAQIAQIHGKSFTDMADIIYNNSLQVINNGQIA